MGKWDYKLMFISQVRCRWFSWCGKCDHHPNGRRRKMAKSIFLWKMSLTPQRESPELVVIYCIGCFYWMLLWIPFFNILGANAEYILNTGHRTRRWFIRAAVVSVVVKLSDLFIWFCAFSDWAAARQSRISTHGFSQKTSAVSPAWSAARETHSFDGKLNLTHLTSS